MNRTLFKHSISGELLLVTGQVLAGEIIWDEAKSGPIPKEMLAKYEASEARRSKRQEAINYLASTDWYIVRELDSGVPCPPDIKSARAAARSKV